MTMAPQGHEDRNDTLALNDMRVHAMAMQCTVHVPPHVPPTLRRPHYYAVGRKPNHTPSCDVWGEPNVLLPSWVGPQRTMCHRVGPQKVKWAVR